MSGRSCLKLLATGLSQYCSKPINSKVTRKTIYSGSKAFSVMIEHLTQAICSEGMFDSCMEESLSSMCKGFQISKTMKDKTETIGC